jgi:hypothetical protein
VPQWEYRDVPGCRAILNALCPIWDDKQKRCCTKLNGAVAIQVFWLKKEAIKPLLTGGQEQI